MAMLSYQRKKCVGSGKTEDYKTDDLQVKNCTKLSKNLLACVNGVLVNNKYLKLSDQCKKCYKKNVMIVLVFLIIVVILKLIVLI